MRLFPATALLVLALTMLAGTASAQTDQDESPAATGAPAVSTGPTATHWYGWQTLLVDGASVSTMLASFALQSGSAAQFGLMGYALGGPIVHGAHGQWEHAYGSLILRVGLPTTAGLTGLAISAAACSRDSRSLFDSCPLDYLAVGFVVGGVVAPFLDAALLGYEPVKNAQAASIAPSIAVNKNGAAFALGGRF